MCIDLRAYVHRFTRFLGHKKSLYAYVYFDYACLGAYTYTINERSNQNDKQNCQIRTLFRALKETRMHTRLYTMHV